MPSFSSFFKKMNRFMFFFFFFLILIWLHQILTAACGIYIPDQELNPAPCTGAWNLSHWTTREVPLVSLPKSPNSISQVYFFSCICIGLFLFFSMDLCQRYFFHTLVISLFFLPVYWFDDIHGNCCTILSNNNFIDLEAWVVSTSSGCLHCSV